MFQQISYQEHYFTASAVIVGGVASGITGLLLVVAISCTCVPMLLLRIFL